MKAMSASMGVCLAKVLEFVGDRALTPSSWWLWPKQALLQGAPEAAQTRSAAARLWPLTCLPSVG